MKRIRRIAVAIVLTLLALSLSACGKSEFGITENSRKHMTIEAENAEKDASFTTGSLEVSDGERVVVASEIEKGMIRVEIVRMPEEQSIDKLPEVDGEESLTADLYNDTGTSATMPAGSYQLKATCIEKATGTVQINVEPVEQ